MKSAVLNLNSEEKNKLMSAAAICYMSRPLQWKNMKNHKTPKMGNGLVTHNFDYETDKNKCTLHISATSMYIYTYLYIQYNIQKNLCNLWSSHTNKRARRMWNNCLRINEQWIKVRTIYKNNNKKIVLNLQSNGSEEGAGCLIRNDLLHSYVLWAFPEFVISPVSKKRL